MSDYCTIHNKEFEIFCVLCQGPEKPMCSICLCEHNQKYHFKGNIHIGDVVLDELSKINEEVLNTAKQKELMKDHTMKLEEALRKKDAAKVQLDDKIKKMQEFWEKQASRATSNETSLSLCKDEIMKEVDKCKDSINDPKELERRVKGLMSQHKYWLAYKELFKALRQGGKLNDKELEAQIAKYEALYQDLMNQLNEVEAASLCDVAGYKKLAEENKANVDEIKDLKNKLKDAEDKNKDLEQKAMSGGKGVDEAVCKDLEEKLKAANAKIKELEDKLKAAEDKNTKLEDRIKELEKRSGELEEQLPLLEKRNKELEAKLSEEEKINKELLPKLKAAEDKINELEPKLKVAEDKIKELEPRLKMEEGRYMELELKLKIEIERCKELEEKIAKHKCICKCIGKHEPTCPCFDPVQAEEERKGRLAKLLKLAKVAMVSPQEEDIVADSATPSSKGVKITRLIKSNLAEAAKGFVDAGENGGKQKWKNAHFILALDCSGNNLFTNSL